MMSLTQLKIWAFRFLILFWSSMLALLAFGLYKIAYTSMLSGWHYPEWTWLDWIIYIIANLVYWSFFIVASALVTLWIFNLLSKTKKTTVKPNDQ